VTQRHHLFAWQRLVVAALALLAPLGYAEEPAQKVVRVGLVHPQSPSTAVRGVSAFWERLRELGYVEGQNFVIEERWANGQLDRLPTLVAEVIAGKVDVLVTFGTQAAVAAKKASSTTPIVGVAMGEPVRTGLVASFARPGSNLTGTSVGWADGIGGKWLELLQETVPRLSTIAVIANLDAAIIARDLMKELGAVAPTRGLKLLLIEVREPGALDRVFDQAARKAQAVLVLPAPLISAQRGRVTALAAKHRLPAMYYLRDFVEVGGLMAYAPDLTIQFQRAADYVDKVLKGTRPADLPIEQPTQWTLVVNLKVARALGLKIPESILLRADEILQ
jgi:putative ABC transport system substrate-binding protein